jgi:DTW domain-containing protein
VLVLAKFQHARADFGGKAPPIVASSHDRSQIVEAARCAAYSGSMSGQTEDGIGVAATTGTTDCPRCQKPLPLCVCDNITPIKSRIALLILQHPQEQDRALGTARLTAMHLANAVLKIGLSWPSLSRALGRPVADPSRWAVLYLGSAKVAGLPARNEIVAINRKGEMEDDQEAVLKNIEGIVLLDGSWSQAKALWWRNPWMLKCQRVILGPSRPSRYGKLRREPRRDGLSTLEAAAMLLSSLEKRPDIAETLLASFERLLARYRKVLEEQPALAPKPRPKRDFRRRRHA